MSNPESIKIDDVKYIREDLINPKLNTNIDGLPCVIARTHSAGVFYGYLLHKDGQELTLLNSNRAVVQTGRKHHDLAVLNRTHYF